MGEQEQNVEGLAEFKTSFKHGDGLGEVAFV